MLSFKEEVLKMKLQSVEEFFHKRETVEKYNVDKIIKLNWECPDVLFSFRGVYAIGVFIYYRQLFGDNVKTDIKVKDEKGATRQRLYSDKFLSENYPQFSDVNDLPEIKGFLEHYYDIGNIIPTWPGANINRGMAHCYDIPNIYYKHHAKFTELIYDKIYNNVLQVLCMHFHSRKNPKMCQKIIMWRFIMMHGKMIMIQTRYCLWCMK